jgi:hypothetical protein
MHTPSTTRVGAKLAPTPFTASIIRDTLALAALSALLFETWGAR